MFDKMNNLQIGKMYLAKEYFWFLFPAKEMALGMRSCFSVEEAYQIAKLLSERYSCSVAVVEENTCFVLLEHDEEYFKVLNSNGNIGWIWCWDTFSRFFELVKK